MIYILGFVFSERTPLTLIKCPCARHKEETDSNLSKYVYLITLHFPLSFYSLLLGDRVVIRVRLWCVCIGGGVAGCWAPLFIQRRPGSQLVAPTFVHRWNLKPHNTENVCIEREKRRKNVVTISCLFYFSYVRYVRPFLLLLLLVARVCCCTVSHCCG